MSGSGIYWPLLMAHGSCGIVRIPHVKGTSSDMISHTCPQGTHTHPHTLGWASLGFCQSKCQWPHWCCSLWFGQRWDWCGFWFQWVGLVSVGFLWCLSLHTHTHPPTLQWLLQFLSFLWCFVALFWLLFPFTDLLFSLFCCLNFCLVFKMIFELALVVVLVCLRMFSLFVVFFVAVPLFFLPPFSLPILFPILFHMLCIVLYCTLGEQHWPVNKPQPTWF